MASGDPARGRGGHYFSRSLIVVVLGGVVQLGLAHLLVGPLAGPGATWLDSGPRLAVSLIVAAVAFAQLAGFYGGAAYASPDHVTRTVPLIGRVLPPIAAAVLVPLCYEPALLEAEHAVFEHVLPTVVATWSAALTVSLVQKRILHAFAIRVPIDPAVTLLRGGDAMQLGRSFGRVLGGSALVASLLSYAAVLAVVADPVAFLLGRDGILLLLAFGSIAAMAVVAGSGFGATPGRDIVSIARRLDALGYDARDTMEWPIKVTSFDEVGNLLAELERLRGRLAGELQVYQEALDRTRQADAQKGAFLAAVSHELRTPLNSVIGFAELLLEDEGHPLTEAQAEDIRLIRAGGHQLLGLINDILDISMIESGELVLNFSPGQLEPMLREIVGIHRPLVRDRNIRLALDVAPDLPEVTCDWRRIGQVVTNLVSNAIKFTESGTITIRAGKDAGRSHVLVRVIDTGIGIAPEELGTIFEEYKQVGSLKRRAKGTGLGLAIARSIVTHHGGALHAESVIGEGSTFTMSLPTSPERTPSSIDMTQEAARAIARARARSPHGGDER
jgi:signal transduction histidine kinase